MRPVDRVLTDSVLVGLDAHAGVWIDGRAEFWCVVVWLMGALEALVQEGGRLCTLGCLAWRFGLLLADVVLH